MKKMFLTTALILIGAVLFAQERIAVFPFEDLDRVFTRNEAIMFYREFSNEFTNKSAGKFTVVPRQDVEKLINTEASFQLSDFSEREKTAEMNRVLNGTQILSGMIGRVGSRLSITVSLYTYPKLEQLPGGTSLRVTNIDEIFDKIPELVQSMQNEISKNLPPAPAYKIGDRGPGGGFVFFAEGGVYMECSMDIGSYDWDDALAIARNYRGGGFRDWRLPTRGEFEIIYRNLFNHGLGGLTGTYWTSTEAADDKKAYGRFMGNDNVRTRLKTYSLAVRAIRNFNQ